MLDWETYGTCVRCGGNLTNGHICPILPDKKEVRKDYQDFEITDIETGIINKTRVIFLAD